MKMLVEWTIDTENDVAYWYFGTKASHGPGCVKRTVPVQADGGEIINVDFDDQGRLLGFEFVGASHLLEIALNQTRVSDYEVAQGLRDAERDGETAYIAYYEGEIAARLNLDLNETEQGLTPAAAQAVEDFCVRNGVQ